MDARRESEPTLMKNRTTVERTSERELVVTRTVNGPARLVFEAWTKPELFRQWWVPKSLGMTLLSCDMDVRVGGTYRVEFAPGDQAAFFGTYQEVTPHSRLVWTNEESDQGSVTTVTFAEKAARRCWPCTSSIPRRKRSTPRDRGGGCDGRVVRATGRASRHPGQVRGRSQPGRRLAEGRSVRRATRCGTRPVGPNPRLPHQSRRGAGRARPRCAAWSEIQRRSARHRSEPG